MFRNPRVRLYAVHLEAHIGFEIIESVEMFGLIRGGTHLFSQARFQFVFTHLQQAAVGVVDDDEFLRIEQVMRNDQRSQRVVGGDAAGVADHVRVAGMQAETVLEKDAGIHAGEHCDMPIGANGKFSEGEIAREGFVGL